MSDVSVTDILISLMKGKTADKIRLKRSLAPGDEIIREDLREFHLSLNTGAEKEALKIEKELKRTGGRILSVADEGYPPLLKEIYNPPWLLYCRGTLPDPLKPSAAIVGTRKASERGLHAAFETGFKLGCEGYAVISGLALGIDGAAHRGNLAGGGKTCAVLGSGIDVIYPKEHKKLAERILKEGGALISEYPPGSEPRKYHFPERNRIISGIGRGLLVVEAPEKSGALISADFALDEGRDVFVHRVGIDNSFRGSRSLAEEGGILISSGEELLKQWKIDSPVDKRNSRHYTDSQLLKMEIEGKLVRFRGQYYFK